MENRATQGFNIVRHVKTHQVYNEYTDLGSCDQEMKRLNDCLTNTNYTQGSTLNESCVSLMETMKHTCGLRRPSNVTRILTRHSPQM